jgi:hypothetical protein
MSRHGSEIAKQHAEKLPAFSSLEEAQRSLYAFRDEHLALLVEIAKGQPGFLPDFQPESLKQLEGWYFQLYETDSFQAIGIPRDVFETCMAMYYGETAARNSSGRWIVEEYFLSPGKYELGVRKGSLTRMLSRFTDHFRTPDNKRRQSLYREYKKYFG